MECDIFHFILVHLKIMQVSSFKLDFPEHSSGARLSQGSWNWAGPYLPVEEKGPVWGSTKVSWQDSQGGLLCARPSLLCPKAPGHDPQAPWGGLRQIPGRAWALGQGLSQEEREGPRVCVGGAGEAGKWEFLAALATIQRVQGWAWSGDGGARLTRAGHCASHWGRGHRSAWNRQRSAVKTWTGDLGWAPAGRRYSFLRLTFEAYLSWPRGLAP